MSRQLRCEGLEIRDGVQRPCYATPENLFRYQRRAYNGGMFRIHLCPLHGEQFGKWGWKCIDTQLRQEEITMTTNEAIQKAIAWLEEIEEWVDMDYGDDGVKSPLRNHAALSNSRVAKETLKKYLEYTTAKVTMAVQERKAEVETGAYVAKLSGADLTPAFSHVPQKHAGITPAHNEAVRLALKERGSKFGVFVCVGYAEVPPSDPIWTKTTTR